MLRGLIVLVAVICLAVAFVALFSEARPAAVGFGIGGLLVLLGTVFERVYYKRMASKAPRGAVRTEERFVDPETGKSVTVYIDPATGERSYVVE